jgi:branched-chain amino acid transport system ATP-binding protein
MRRRHDDVDASRQPDWAAPSPACQRDHDPADATMSAAVTGATIARPVLAARDLVAGYHRHAVVRSLNLQVDAGNVVALLGPNGAGKTTTMRTLAGDLQPIAGDVLVDGVVSTAPLHRRTQQGLAYVSEERSVFGPLTVRENLKVGRCRAEDAVALFPELEPLLGRRAELLSGGEQQILTLARVLARGPRCLIADEISLGLAPLVITRLLEAVRAAATRTGMAVILVEQHVRQTLAIADHVYVMRGGEIVLEGAAADFADRLEEIELSYLDGAA